MGESGWQILRAEADDLRRKLENVHEGRKRAIERARVAESLNTRYLAEVTEVARVLHDMAYRPFGPDDFPKLEALAERLEALAPDAGTETTLKDRLAVEVKRFEGDLRRLAEDD